MIDSREAAEEKEEDKKGLDVPVMGPEPEEEKWVSSALDSPVMD